MPSSRLSALDASFLTAETATAHMHVGWVAVFDPRSDGSRPDFAELRQHILERLDRAPRYRQRLATVPLGVHRPVWIDDADFDIDYHVLRAHSDDLSEVVAHAMSSPLERSRPLWECWVADRLADGRVGVVGKAHHCMVDGMAAIELASLLVDTTEEVRHVEGRGWRARPASGALGRALRGARERLTEDLSLATTPARLLTSPSAWGRLLADARRAADALADTFISRPQRTRCLNRPISAQRHLGMYARPTADLVQIKTAFDTTLNDVVLAACAGGLGRFLAQRGEEAAHLTAMVPVNVRHDDQRDELGNRISFMFVPLPNTEEDTVAQLLQVAMATGSRKSGGIPQGSETVLSWVSRMPAVAQRALTHLAASPRTFSVAISNMPGPSAPLWMAGCPLREAYPVVPLAESHALSIGVMTVGERIFFGLYADRKALPDVDVLVGHVAAVLDELLEHTSPPDDREGRFTRTERRPSLRTVPT